MKIAIHAFDGITMFHLAAPLVVFGEVIRQGLAEDWSMVVFSADGAPVRTADGILLADIAGPAAAATADLLVLPSWPAEFPPVPDTLADLVRTAHERGTAVAGLCLGAVPVAASGILDGRTAVTHWAGAAALARAHPEVTVEPAALYLDHGDVLTSAGTASALDACLHLVRTRLGAEAAATVARHLVIAPHREGSQAQYIERPLPADHGTGPIADAMTWALAHLDEPLGVAELAAHAHMSTRNFSRRFRETAGTSPAKWLLARRLDDARRLLETTEWSITRIAAACGFASAVTFRQNFVAAYATTPTSYRRRFGS
ncbi:GlxA family transcriptional regulator [Granulicoccus phenolivorans]|uniref:GlxA family transcriptional regulator n=1 Tax=Granulicoccus phenolivorans TaxID=266854 RepID=UPI00040C2A21|nr:helix-turn-helix domain-containing protein [Granulicoccus phenolivorans]